MNVLTTVLIEGEDTSVSVQILKTGLTELPLNILLSTIDDTATGNEQCASEQSESVRQVYSSLCL